MTLGKGRMLAVGLVLLCAGCLTYEEFTERLADKRCEENLECAPAGPVGDCALFEVPGAANCDFDPGAASRCLRQEWECNEDLPGFEFAEPAPACDLVCVRAAE